MAALKGPLLLWLVAAQASVTAQAARLSIEEKFDAFVKQVQKAEDSSAPDKERATAIANAYRAAAWRQIAETELSEASNAELDFLFRAADTAAFYTEDPAHVNDMALALKEMQRRQMATPLHLERMYGALLSTRMLDELKAFAASHAIPGKKPLPEFRGTEMGSAAVPSEWVVGRAASAYFLERRAVTLLPDWQLIVASHPNCHFSRDAIRDIASDPALMALLKDRQKWISPQDRTDDFRPFLVWNKRYPDAPASIAFLAAEWPFVDTWATPTFYLLKNGRLAAKVVGWPKQGNRAKLMEAIELARRTDPAHGPSREESPGKHGGTRETAAP